MCSVLPEGIIDLRLIVMLLVGMSWADVLSVMLARGVMCDVRHPRQEEALWLAQGGGYIRRWRWARPLGEGSWVVDLIGDRRSLDVGTLIVY